MHQVWKVTKQVCVTRAGTYLKDSQQANVQVEQLLFQIVLGHTFVKSADEASLKFPQHAFCTMSCLLYTPPRWNGSGNLLLGGACMNRRRIHGRIHAGET